MIAEENSAPLDVAREELFAWVAARQDGVSASSGDLADDFCQILRLDTDLELRTVRNPSSFMFEARWYENDREIAEFAKPFCAEEAAEARVLACAALLRLP